MWRTLPLLAVLVTGCSDGRSPVAPETQNPPGQETSLLRQLASGGYVLFFRHTERDGSAISTGDLAIADNAGTCVPGSELTPKGVSDALAIREAFAHNRIGVDRVYASPTCRTKQMAQLIFRRFSTTRALTWPDMWTQNEEPSLTPGLRRLLGSVPGTRRNTVLVSHSNVLQAARIGVDVPLGQGDAAVFRPLGEGRFDLVGTIPLQQWFDARTSVGYNAMR